MVVRNHPRGRLVFNRDAIVRAALRAYVEAIFGNYPLKRLSFPACDVPRWMGDLQRGVFRNDGGSGSYEVVAWTEAGVVGLAYELGFGPIAHFGLTPDTVTGGPEDVRGAVPGLPAELEPAFQMAASMLDTRSDLYEGNVPNRKMYSERLAGVGFWLHGERVGGTLFDDPTAAGALQLVAWGLLHNGRLLPLSCEAYSRPRPGKIVVDHARPQDAPIHALIDTVVDRRMPGPTEFTTDELATLIPKPPDPTQLLGAQRMLQKAGITWPGSPELPEPPKPSVNDPFTRKPFGLANRPAT